MNYTFDKGLYAKLFEIFDTIAKKGTYTPGDIIDIINNHVNMHFGTKNLTREFVEIILYALYKDNENAAKYIFDEYKDEIDMSVLVYTSLVAEVDPIIVDTYFDNWEIKENDQKKPTAIILQVLKKSNDEYMDILIDHENVVEALTVRNVEVMFHTFTKRFMRTEMAIKRWKILLDNFKHLNDKMSEVVSKDTELMEIFYPNALDIFIF